MTYIVGLINKLIFVAATVTGVFGGTVISHAVPVFPSSYDMPNGSGVARGGEYNYWDVNYTGFGNKTVDGATLTGGVGKLTDGIVATQSWEWADAYGAYSQQNISGTGPYVGWTWGDPTITFHFANLASIDSMTFHVDNPANDSFGNPRGGVAAPGSFTINGTERLSGVNNTSEGTGPLAINVTDLGLANIQDLAVTINRDLTRDINGNEVRFWAFVSEITFDDGLPVPVPEPATFILFGAGIAAVALFRQLRRG